MPIVKVIQADAEGVALVYHQLSIASMVHQARISPEAGAVAIVGFRDNPNHLGTPMNIVLQTKDGNIVARNVFIWNIGNVEVVRNVKDEVELTGPKTVMMAFSGCTWHLKGKQPLPWATGQAPMGKRPAQGQSQAGARAKQVEYHSRQDCQP